MLKLGQRFEVGEVRKASKISVGRALQEKGPEMGVYLAWSRDSREASAAGTE